MSSPTIIDFDILFDSQPERFAEHIRKAIQEGWGVLTANIDAKGIHWAHIVKLGHIVMTPKGEKSFYDDVGEEYKPRGFRP